MIEHRLPIGEVRPANVTADHLEGEVVGRTLVVLVTLLNIRLLGHETPVKLRRLIILCSSRLLRETRELRRMLPTMTSPWADLETVAHSHVAVEGERPVEAAVLGSAELAFVRPLEGVLLADVLLDVVEAGELPDFAVCVFAAVRAGVFLQ